MSRTILITGVTGNQGGAVAQALQGSGFRLRDVNAVELMVDGAFTGAPFGAPIFQDGFRPLGSEAKLAKAHAEGDPQ